MKLVLLLVFLGAWGGGGAWADHTGVMQLNDRVGPYVVRAFSEPDPPRTDRCRITVTVLQPGGQRPVPTAVVSVSASLAGGRRRGSRSPPTGPATRSRCTTWPTSSCRSPAGGP